MSDIIGSASGSGGDIFGTASFEGNSGQGFITPAQVTVSGVGAVAAPRVGSGGVTVSLASVAGAGVVRVTGTGNIAAPAGTVSGSGSAVFNAPGTGSIFANNAAVSGEGVMTPPTMVGVAAVIAPQAGVSGTGGLIETAGGNVWVSEALVSGSGNVTLTLPSTGVIFGPLATVGGSGTVITPYLPTINDGGNLTVTLPPLAQSADLNYPEIRQWINTFYSDVPVTNNASFVLSVASSPIAVTFTATNQWGSTSLTRTVTLQVQADTGTGQLAPNPADLRALFPQFATSAWPDVFVDSAIERAMCHISTSNYGRLTGECRLKAIYLMAAHLLYITDQSASGGNAGVVTSSAIDKVSVGFAAPPHKSMWQWWLSISPYGSELISLLSAKSTGGFYIGGSHERRGFRKAGGGF